MRAYIYLTVCFLLCGGCESGGDKTLARDLAEGLIAACPAAAANDEQARAGCADKLRDFQLLRDRMREPFIWGGQRVEGDYALDRPGTNRFNPLVWRKMYLSLFSFPGTYQIEEIDGAVILHMPYRFRNELDDGSYPYPFWHSKKKWDGYEFSTEMFIRIEGGQVSGALRGTGREDRPHSERKWDGQWRWNEGGQEMPSVTLYNYLMSPANPYTRPLDSAYRALEAEMRPHLCVKCHSPDNAAAVDQLEFFNYPNQALYARHNIVRQVTKGDMPPPPSPGNPSGIADAGARQRLADLAANFAALGDAALAFEGENKQPEKLP